MRQFIFILLLFVSIATNAQRSLTLGVSIRIACGFVGETSPEVSAIQRLVQAKSYSLLKDKLAKGNKAEAILTAIALKELQLKQGLELSEAEQQRIREIASWQEEYNVCYTCTQHFKGTVSELLKNKNSFAYLLIKQTLVKEN